MATVWRQRHPNAVPAAFAGVTAGLLAALIAVAHAAPSATATKKDEPFHANVPAALLFDPDSESILYEKNGEELVAPASLAIAAAAIVFSKLCTPRKRTSEQGISTAPSSIMLPFSRNAPGETVCVELNHTGFAPPRPA